MNSNMNTPLISVIIPVYNAGAYLHECLTSVRACPDSNIECILVNDGSTDGSGGICAAAVAGDSRFRLIEKENSGVSDSRNTGMAAARGEYIFFLDADDYIDIAQWGEILRHAREGRADFIAFGYYSLFTSGKEKSELFRIEGGQSDSPDDTYSALLASPMLNTCWGKLLRRTVIEENSVRFDSSLVTCEDAVFIIDFVDSAQSFLLCNRCVLHYRIHDSSAMRRRPLENKLEDFALLYSRREKFFSARYGLDQYGLDRPGLTIRNDALREQFSVLTNMLLEYAAAHSLSDTRTACAAMLSHTATRDVVSRLDPRGIAPFYKRLEYEMMRRSLTLPLSFYFKLKGNLY